MEENIEKKSNVKKIVAISLAVLILLGAILALTLILKREVILDESEYNTLLFDYNDEDYTCMVSINPENKPEGDLVVPAKVKHNEKVYKIDWFRGHSYDMFEGCTELISITFPKDIDFDFSGPVFSDCQKLEKIVILSGGNKCFTYKNGIYFRNEDGEVIFLQGCKNTTEIKEGTVGMSYGLENTLGLTNITIPASVKSIYGFSGCVNLTSVKIKDPTGWYYYEGSGEKIRVSETDLKDTANAAQLLVQLNSRGIYLCKDSIKNVH